MDNEERKQELKRLGRDLLYYLENYNELTRTRPHYKKIVNKEIKEITNKMKALSR